MEKKRFVFHPDLLKALSVITPEEKTLLDGKPLAIENYISDSDYIINSAKLLEAGKLINIRPHTRFTAFPAHTHNYVEIIYMCTGQTCHTINGNTELILRSGELLILNQHASHSIARAEKNDIAVNFIVLPTFFDTVFSMIGTGNLLSRLLLGGLRMKSGDISYLHFQIADILPVQNLIENMIWGLIYPQANNRHINQLTMGVLFTHLLNHTDRLMASGSTHISNPFVVAALQDIEENYQYASLSEIARKHNISIAYLSRLVKEATGNTYKELLQEKRLSKSVQLLKTTGLPIQDIIRIIGYDNASYFFRIFQEKYRMSPRKYRHEAE